MKLVRSLSLVPFLLATPVSAQPAPAEPVTVEHYYRIKWGSAAEFKRLYKANHEPLLVEMQKQGFITAIRTDEPFTHMAGGQRWDLRVTISYRDAPSAVVVGGAFDKAFETVLARLYPDKKKLDAEEAKRFGLLEEHWDVIVIPSGG
jgi:hypothetical protein